MSEGLGVVVSDEARALVPGTLVAHNYRVTGHLGAGGMGTVFLGENVTLRQDVVVKVLRVGGHGAGAEEARVLASLDHPNVVHVYAYDERWDCIVMQRLHGRSLQDAAFPPPGSKEARLDPISCLRVVAQTAQALSAVHERGMVHRDVKPDNVMLDFTGGEVKWVKLIDFGLALRVGRTVAAPAGTPEFCSPEQFEATAPAHPANDVYALGVSLFYLLTGCYPFDGTPEDIAQAHCRQAPPDLVDTLNARLDAPLDPHLGFVFEKVGELLERVLQKEPATRPTARELSFALSELVDRFSSENTQVGRVVPAPMLLTEVAPRASSTMVLNRSAGSSIGLSVRAERRTRALTAIVVLAGLVGVVGFLVSWTGARELPALPTSAVPTSAVPTSALPTSALPTSALPTSALPTSALPTSALPEKPSSPSRSSEDPEALVPLPPVAAASIDAGTPRRLPVPNSPVVASVCAPSEAWRKGALAQLADLGAIASKKSVSVGLWFDGEEQRVSERVRAAATPAECAAVETVLARLQHEIERK